MLFLLVPPAGLDVMNHCTPISVSSSTRSVFAKGLFLLSLKPTEVAIRPAARKLPSPTNPSVSPGKLLSRLPHCCCTIPKEPISGQSSALTELCLQRRRGFSSSNCLIVSSELGANCGGCSYSTIGAGFSRSHLRN